MDTYDNQVAREEINATYMLNFEEDESVNRLAERVGRRRADAIADTHPMIAVSAVDNGGAYVDIHLFGSPVAVVNTWDYGKGARMYPFTQDGTHDLVMDWIAEDLFDYLNEYA